MTRPPPFPPGSAMDMLLCILDRHEIPFEFSGPALHVLDTLVLHNTGISELPDSLLVQGDLDIEETTLWALPEHLTVMDSLYLQGLPITELPASLTLHGSLDLEDTRITALPAGFTVQGDLSCAGPLEITLPDGLVVQQSLVLEDGNVPRLPANMWVGGAILPSPHMIDILRFMQGRPDVVQLSRPATAHALLQQRHQLSGFPDLLRVAQAIQGADILTITRKDDGTLTTVYDWNDT